MSYARRYDAARVAVGQSRLVLDSGPTVVLELAKEEGLLVPDGMSGFTLLLEVDSNRLTPGAMLYLPDTGVVTFLSLFRSISHDTTSLVAGTIEIRKLTRSYVEARLNLAAELPQWEAEASARFRRMPAACFGKRPEYVRTKGCP
jgi:hypothetical protein